jgi:hypothetical protein
VGVRVERASALAGALVLGCADEGLPPTSTDGRSCLASWSHSLRVRPIGTDSATVSEARQRPRIVTGNCESRDDGRGGDRSRPACSGLTRQWLRRRTEQLFEWGCCRPCPRASFDQGFTSGDVKGMPSGIGEVISEYRHAKPSSRSSSRMSRRRPCGAGRQTDAGRHVRAAFAGCAQTPSRSAGPRPGAPNAAAALGWVSGSERSAEPCTASSAAPR